VIDYIRTYKQFTSSHYFYEGLRMTAGVMVPVLLLSSYGYLSMGVSIALGAMCVGITDNPGPIHHRRNGMLITMVLLFATTIITGLSVPSNWLTMVLVVVLPFLFSIIGIYGTRATSAGMACMLIMVLNIDKTQTPSQVFQNALLVVTGGAWYFLLSIGMHQLRPYKLVQQVLGDCMLETAKYLRIKAAFYDTHVDFDKNYHALTDAQVHVHQKQETVRELLFKTRSIVKESTVPGRVLVMAFTDTIDLFERIMTSQQEYRLLHQHFGDTVLLEAFQEAIIQLANDLDELGIAFQEGRTSNPIKESRIEVESLEALFLKERTALLNENNADAFISLRHILNSIKDLQHRIDRLHDYSSYDRKTPKTGRSERDLKRFVTRSDYNPKILFDNLHIHSNIFRHSVRVSLALLAGYTLSIFLPVGHDYWILLTIIVILKPAYALTRQRNVQRLGGTLAGAALAALILFAVKQTSVLVGIIMICMITTYSLIRINYFISVIFMTTYIIVAFHFLKSGTITMVLQDRIVDTAIGSLISFVLLYLIPPKWEHENIRSLCMDAIIANKSYYAYIAGAFAGKEFITQQYKLKRKESYVAMANLGDAFQRMLNEPKSKQQHGKHLHQLVVSNHVLVSHIATLSAYWQQFGKAYALPAFESVIGITSTQLITALQLLGDDTYENINELDIVPDVAEIMQTPLHQSKLATEATDLKSSNFKTITDQFEIILRVAIDIKSIAKKLGAV
jgi:uncharacterized membrane protein YccC